MTGNPRIVSLIASATEIVCALGAEKWLVGISHECDYPEHVLNRPRCTSSRITSETDSGEIDALVRSMADSGESLYSVDATTIKRLAPTLILTQVQCEVCAVSPRDLEGIGLETLETAPQVLPLNTFGLEDLYTDILRVARAIRLEGHAFRLIDKLRGRLDTLKQRTKSFPKKKVACLEWLDPLMISGNWMPELVKMVGGKAVLTNDWGKSRTISFDDLCDADPDVIVCMPCGFDLERTLLDTRKFGEDLRWRELRAYRNGMTYAVDGNSYFNRPGPRLVDSAELMAQLLHPAVFDFPDYLNFYRTVEFDN
ncbi:MAG: cobalamin-binding protein [Calditrichaeota bacterium]|nr:cobalamin-binding protein [Calditrichota bacterium]MCB9368419.1 cobalamin-binding protein [Calditrichota bacterium]